MGYPSSQGLYDPANEHDACGVGMVAHIKGEKSHASIAQALPGETCDEGTLSTSTDNTLTLADNGKVICSGTGKVLLASGSTNTFSGVTLDTDVDLLSIGVAGSAINVTDTLTLGAGRTMRLRDSGSFFPVTMNFTAPDGKQYILNLIDTPGHVDFSYEVSRSLAACEGALLVVDAAQGVEAQTLANVYQSIEHDHEIVPVINKIDLPAADAEKVKAEIEEIIGIEAEDAVRVSAKTGENVDELLEELVRRVPPPQGEPDGPLQALIIDSWYDSYVGVVSLVRVVNGSLRTGHGKRRLQLWISV